MTWWTVTKDILGALYNLAGIVLVIGLFSGIAQLKLLKKDLNDRNKRSARESSLQYLTIYASEIIPLYDSIIRTYRDEIGEFDPNDELFNAEFTITEDQLTADIMSDLIILTDMNLHTFLNKLEFFSTAMLNGLVDEDLVFTPVGKSFCKIVRTEHLYISYSRGRGTPYKNIIELYNRWSDRLEVENLELQKREADAKIKAKGDGYKSKPPIGF